MPVEEVPTRTTIRLCPRPASRTAWDSTRSCSRNTYPGSTRCSGEPNPGPSGAGPAGWTSRACGSHVPIGRPGPAPFALAVPGSSAALRRSSSSSSIGSISPRASVATVCSDGTGPLGENASDTVVRPSPVRLASCVLFSPVRARPPDRNLP